MTQLELPFDDMKFDHGKPRPTLLLQGLNESLSEVLEVLEYGARKYRPDSWQTVPDAAHRYTDALLRHTMAWLSGQENDPESNLRHLAHLATNALFLLQLVGHNVQHEIPVNPRLPEVDSRSRYIVLPKES